MAGSIIIFALFVIIYIVISDIITVFFRLTGLTEEKARFQVISLLTNSGFTTRESEAVVSSKIRRRLAQATMIFGYTFTVTIVSTTVNFLMTIGQSELASLFWVLPVVIVILALLQLLRKSSAFKTQFDGLIERVGNRIMFGKNSNAILLVEEYGEMVVAHVDLQQVPPMLQERTLAESGLMQKYNIMVLMVKNKNGEARQANARTVLQKEDIIMVLGKRKNVREVFEKVPAPANTGVSGDDKDEKIKRS